MNHRLAIPRHNPLIFQGWKLFSQNAQFPLVNAHKIRFRLRMSNTATEYVQFAKVFAPSEKGWSMVIGELVTYFNSMQEAITAADAHNAQRK